MKRQSHSIVSAISSIVLILASCALGNKSYTLSQLQGAWWSDRGNPTADFAINGNQIWLDYDSKYHLCRITGGNTLVYDLGPDLGTIERKIIILEGDNLTLEAVVNNEPVQTKYVREN